MLVQFGSYDICDGTLAGGVAVSQLRVRGDRLYDFVLPVDNVDATLLDRITTTTDISFIVQRTHASQQASEEFILSLDSSLPASGTVTLTTTGPSPTTRVIPNGFLLDHELIDEHGCTTFHQYHLTGGPPVAP